ncbi:MFS transporter [Pimelobacter sp. 30-1]|uniref:MFS transporter n=1 Tax=Pimelobacter sp. 30-1 TaxID=2004991 RepID=UPI001C0481D1|nr:MFS transporter [Pimelobacter sp. 30-1]MBU2697085.1 MFS transporter [Pimelobacter sp. 30-1]
MTTSARTRTLLLAAVGAVAVATIYAAQPVLVAMGTDLGISGGTLGWLVAAGQLGYLVGLVVLVPLGDLLDRRRLLVGHLLLTGTGTAVVALAGSTGLVLAGLAATGLFAVVVQIAVAYAADLAPAAERGHAIGLVTSGVVLGILGVRLLAGLLADLTGWRSVYAALALATFALAGLARLVLPPDPRDRSAGRVRGGLGGLLRDRLFVARGLVVFFLFASFGTLWSGLALPLTADPWHLTSAQVGLFGLAGLAGALGAARTGRARTTTASTTAVRTALVVLVGSWLAIAQAPWSLWVLGAGVVLLDYAVQAVHVDNQHRLTEAYPGRSSSVIGGYMVFYSLGSALGAATTAAAYAAGGWVASSLLGAGFALGALAAATLLRERRFAAPPQ